MCSIIGYYGKNLAAPILVKGLQKMEYRGYDSVGVATKTDTEILVKKGVGKVIEVNTKVQLDNLPGMVGIGHTRWATHGGVSDKNAISHFVRNMPAYDSRVLRKYVTENEPGINMKTSYSCQSCQHNNDIKLPITPEFFWPDT